MNMILPENTISDYGPALYDFSLEALDFGPISACGFKLSPLTLFTGPTNSGKSYSAMLIYALFECFKMKGQYEFYGRSFRFRRSIKKADHNRVFKGEDAFIKNIQEMNPGDEIPLPESVIKNVYTITLRDLFERKLSEEIIRSYATPLKNLIRSGKRSFRMNLKMNGNTIGINHTKNGLSLKKQPPPLSIKLRKIASMYHTLSLNKEKNRIEFYLKSNSSEELSQFMDNLTFSISDLCLTNLLGDLEKTECLYLPSARSGILQGHKALSASIVRESPYAGIRLFDIPRFSGVVSDFISRIITLGEEPGPLYELAVRMEHDLLNGEIGINRTEESHISEICYKQKGMAIPLSRASSTVSELAPLSLYVKYAVGPGAIVIIEEPEAHLHTENRRLLAKYIARLVRKGVYVVINTHSEILVEQLNNLILMSELDERERAKFAGYEKGDYIRPDEVGAYMFSYDNRSGGFKTKKLHTDRISIHQANYSTVCEALITEKNNLRKKLK